MKTGNGICPDCLAAHPATMDCSILPIAAAPDAVKMEPWEILRDIVTPAPFHHNKAAWTIILRLIGEKCFAAPDAGDAELIAEIVRDVAELPDRTSPHDWPDAMLVTAEELTAILADRLSFAQGVEAGS